MLKTCLATSNAPEAIGPYSQAVRAGPWVFLSGQIALEPKTGLLVAGGVREQTEQVLRNLGAVLREAGLDYGHVVKTTVYLKDLDRFGEMNEAYARCFGSHSPARSTVEVSGLPKGALVEIDAVALGLAQE